jgi:hypothetical protein
MFENAGKRPFRSEKQNKCPEHLAIPEQWYLEIASHCARVTRELRYVSP